MDSPQATYAGSPSDNYARHLRQHVWPHLTSGQIAVLTALTSYADWTTGRCGPAITTLAADIGMDRGHVSRIMKQLVAGGVVKQAGAYLTDYGHWIKVWALIGYDRFVPHSRSTTSNATIDAEAVAEALATTPILEIHSPDAPAPHKQNHDPNHNLLRAAAPAAIVTTVVEPQRKPTSTVHDPEAIRIITTATDSHGKAADERQAVELLAIVSETIAVEQRPPILRKLASILKVTVVQKSIFGWWSKAIREHLKYHRGEDEAGVQQKKHVEKRHTAEKPHIREGRQHVQMLEPEEQVELLDHLIDWMTRVGNRAAVELLRKVDRTRIVESEPVWAACGREFEAQRILEAQKEKVS